ncbi:MAG: hypothetical protein COX57_00745 [Alphaproteobacteria bacterium CG_4_10_14_0_2_um_filter_63_37]|nr:MAG: hypothetical protein AUJ55_07225 [Proteobacteria bacterium CG1_02_64_396]PJA25957.1 MAG: hypothetical protein COX57_00745 [Alphaproteobacteria bacterium CG_4_10_14_0_2_um_filter_63_37]
MAVMRSVSLQIVAPVLGAIAVVAVIPALVLAWMIQGVIDEEDRAHLASLSDGLTQWIDEEESFDRRAALLLARTQSVQESKIWLEFGMNVALSDQSQGRSQRYVASTDGITRITEVPLANGSTKVYHIERTLDASKLMDLGQILGAPVAMFDAQGALLWSTAPFPDQVPEQYRQLPDREVRIDLGGREGEDQKLWYQLGDAGYLAVLHSRGALRDARTLIEQTIEMIAALALFTIGLLLFFLRWRVFKPLGLVTNCARYWDGPSIAKLPVMRSDELGDLAKAMRRQWTHIQIKEEELAERNTNLANLNADLAEATRQLERIDQLKTYFLTNVSHELRTPLTSIVGFARLLERRIQGDDLRDAAGIIAAEGERLTFMINDLLDLSRIEAGKMEWRFNPLNLLPLVHEVGALLMPQAQDKGLILTADGAPCSIMADRDRIKQVLINLAGNAVKFTETGKVWIHVAPEEGGGAVVEVGDTGSGISELDQERIFRRFEQGASKEGKPQGTGIGLHLIREIAHAHGARIELSSREGEGSLFKVHLPAHPPEDATPPAIEV